MARDKYISVKDSISGFSFANLGFFAAFGNGIINAVYSLVLLDIFHNSATVGIYVALYSIFCMFITLFADEIFRYISKAKLFYISMISIAIMYFMMAFPIKAQTFITLDFASGIPLVLIGLLIPLFMADFAKNISMAKLNGRYQFWTNVGALFAPMIAMFIAGIYGNRETFFLVSGIFLFGAFFFKYFRIVQEDKKPKKINPRKTLKTIWNHTVEFTHKRDLMRAYAINFGFSFLAAMRSLYVPIIMIEQGFSKEKLGLVLMLGVIPYVLLSQPLGKLAEKYGSKIWMVIGFLSFSVFAFWASFATGWTLFLIFILWQIPGALIDPIKDLMFFDATKKNEQSKFMGIFKTSSNLPKFIAPLIGAGFIMVFGGTSAVWIITGIVSILSAWILLEKPRQK